MLSTAKGNSFCNFYRYKQQQIYHRVWQVSKLGCNLIFNLPLTKHVFKQKLEDKRPIRRFLLALAEGPSWPLVKMTQNSLTDGRGANNKGLKVRFDIF